MFEKIMDWTISNQAPKTLYGYGEGSTTIPYGSRLASGWQVEVVGALIKSKDIVWSYMKM